jgi:hypothetical protein
LTAGLLPVRASGPVGHAAHRYDIEALRRVLAFHDWGMPMKIRARTLLTKLALVVGALLVTFVVAEVGVRVLGLAPPAAPKGDAIQNVLEFDDKLETRYRPGARTTIHSQYGEFTAEYAFNELGLRDRPIPPRSEDRSYRILALGNSFVEGWGVRVEDSFLRVAEERWNAAGSGRQRPVRLINAGASGYGAAQCYLLCKDLLPRVQPDAVVFFYIPTMLSADHKFMRKAEVDGQGLALGLNVEAVLNPPAPSTGTGTAFDDSSLTARLAEYSSLVRLIRVRLANRAAQRSIIRGDPQSDLLAAYRAPVESLAEMHEPALRHIAGMARLAREAGVPFLVVQLPMPFEVSDQEWVKGRKIYGLDGVASERPELTRLPAAFLRAQDVGIIAAHEFLASRAAHGASDPRIYFDYDFHLNVVGQRLLGTWLADTLARHIP